MSPAIRVSCEPRILVISSLFERPDSATGAFIHRQCEALVSKGMEVHVLCPISGLRRGEFKESFRRIMRKPETRMVGRVPVTYLWYLNVPHAISVRMERYSLARSLLGSIPAGDFDVVHAYRLFPIGDAAVSIARELNVPLVVSARGSDVHTNPYRNPGIMARTVDVIRSADVVTAVSQDLANKIYRLAQPEAPVQIVRNGVDSEVFTPATEKEDLRRRLGISANVTIFVTVSRLVPEKGLQELVDAFSVLASERTDVQLLVVGEGPMRGSLERDLADRDLSGAARFVGARDHQEVPEWLAASDVFVLPSHAEGLPNALLESMACGLPSIATKVGGIPEALGMGIECGILVEPRETGALTEAMRFLAEEPEAREAMGESARSRVLDEFSWESSAAGLTTVYARARNSAPADHTPSSSVFLPSPATE